MKTKGIPANIKPADANTAETADMMQISNRSEWFINISACLMSGLCLHPRDIDQSSGWEKKTDLENC